MYTLFFISGGVAVASSVMAVTRADAVHALLYTVVSLLSVGMVFFILGAPFAAALEVTIYAGAIMVLLVFVVMMLGLGGTIPEEKGRFGFRAWVGPASLSLILAGELAYALGAVHGEVQPLKAVGPGEVSVCLFGPYALGVELASMLLLAGLTGAFHLGRRVGGMATHKQGDGL